MYSIKRGCDFKNFWKTHNLKKCTCSLKQALQAVMLKNPALHSVECLTPDWPHRSKFFLSALPPRFECSQFCMGSSIGWSSKPKCEGGLSCSQSLNLRACVSLPPFHFDDSSSKGSLSHLSQFPKGSIATLRLKWDSDRWKTGEVGLALRTRHSLQELCLKWNLVNQIIVSHKQIAIPKILHYIVLIF